MNIKEVSAEGLSRELQITVPAADLVAKLDTRIDEIKGTVQLKGFRPGKVPAAHIRKTYGDQLMGEVIQETVSETSQKMLTAREERPAMQPEIKLVGEVDAVIQGDGDLVYDIVFDIIPSIDLIDFSTVKLTRPVVEVDDEKVDEALERLASSRKDFEPRGKTAKAREGDRVKIDFVGRIDGEAFEGGTAEGFELELGSGQFIPGFEDQLVGTKAGDTKDVEVSFPEEYGNAELAGKPSVFEVTVHEVSAPKEGHGPKLILRRTRRIQRHAALTDCDSLRPRQARPRSHNTRTMCTSTFSLSSFTLPIPSPPFSPVRVAFDFHFYVTTVLPDDDG